MSADNGIYIAKFPIDDTKSNFEYRVAHLQNIEDCFPQSYRPGYRPEYVVDALIVVNFGDAKVFYVKDNARKYAEKLYDDEMNSESPIVEHGICEIEFTKPVQEISKSKAENILSKYWLDFQHKRANASPDTCGDVDSFLNKKNYLRELIEKYNPLPMETVYEQSVRYGKIAYNSFKKELNDSDKQYDIWSDLSITEQQAWITVGVQIEKITLIENK